MSKWLWVWCLTAAGASASEWVSLMPTQETVPAGVLSGNWTLDGDVLIGRAEAGEIAWWRAPGDFWDFELEVEFRTQRPANGGLQYRSHWLPKVPPANPAQFQMYGYQANIETRAKGRTGEIIDENGRGRLVEAAKDSHDAVSQRQWNRLSVMATGPVSVVKINGVTAATLSDEAMIGGGIAVQAMGGDTGPAEVHYRNLRIRNLGRAGSWRALFDGASLTGWVNWGTERWDVAGGVIQGRRGPKESEGYLATTRTWRDFRVRGRFHMLGKGNYGLFYHATIRLRDDGYPLISGVQGEVEPGYPGSTGWHYESYRRGWIVPPDKASVAAYLLRRGEWNEIEIRSLGNHITSWVNGFRVTDFHDSTRQLFEGTFALQLHAGAGAGIDWRDLYVEE